jgi:hypothetical protein
LTEMTVSLRFPQAVMIQILVVIILILGVTPTII